MGFCIGVTVCVFLVFVHTYMCLCLLKSQRTTPQLAAYHYRIAGAEVRGVALVTHAAAERPLLRETALLAAPLRPNDYARGTSACCIGTSHATQNISPTTIHCTGPLS